MLRYAASLVIASYVKVRLIPRDLRALHLDLFTRSSIIVLLTVGGILPIFPEIYSREEIGL